MYATRFLRRALCIWYSLIVLSVCATLIPSRSFALQPTQAHLPSGQIELSRLVDLASQKLNLRITYDESALRAKVTLRLPSGVSDAELWELTNRLLAEQGLVTARLGGRGDPALAVIKIASAAQIMQAEAFDAAALPEGPGQSPDDYPPSFRRLGVRLSHIPTREAAAAIGPLLSKPGGSVVEEPASRMIIIADLRGFAEAAARAALALDTPALEVQLTEYPCTNLAAGALVMLATQVAAKRDALAGGPSSPAPSPASASVPASRASGAGGSGELIASPDGRRVLVLARIDRLPAWIDLLGRLDQREALASRRYSAGPLLAADAARLIEQSIAAGRAADPAAAIADDRWLIAPDDLTGTLLITGTPAQHEMVGQMLASLAAAPPESRRPLKTFVLRHRSVREVVGVVERLINAGALDAAGAAGQSGADGADGSAGSALDQSALSTTTDARSANAESSNRGPARVSAPARELPPLLSGLGEGRDSVRGGDHSSRGGRGRTGLTLTADEATNTLIAIGEPRLLAQLEALLPTLDVRQAQVMIEAVLVSLSDSQTMQLGVELEKIEVSGDTVFRLASLFGLSTAGAGGAGGGGRIVGDAAGFTGVVLNPGEFSIILRALETINNGRAISVPKVLVNNNQQASFNSSLQQPYASTNASSTVATTSFGGTFDAGTVITVRPQIAEGDHLVLDYQVRLSSFTGSATANLPPPRQENSVTSIATIPDGYTVVVGGLEAITDGEGESRVPGIGAIPIIGELFKNRTSQRSRARFFVFLRANVMRGTTGSGTGFEELKYLSDRAAEDSGIAGEFDGWPVMRPRVIR
ncbi:MAG: type II secretion system protein GspD [Phycisphaeraceae bacterium]|nr:type II secretion system protein GspD [Phycisphaeraceae bacterium]